MLGWWAAPEAPNVATTTAGQMGYRYKYSWNTAAATGTTQKLLGHNGSHTVSLVAVDGVSIVGIPTAGIAYTGSAKTKPSDMGISVKNLTISDVVTSSGNADYFKFYTYSDDAMLRNPTVSFRINDEGDAHRYKWKVRIRSTDAEYWTDGILITGEADGPGVVTAKVNDPEAENQTQTDNTESEYAEIAEMGTYTFELSVAEIDSWSNPLGDSGTYRSVAYLPYTMPGFPDRSGHGGKIVTEADGTQKYYVDYYLRNDTSGLPAGTQASSLDIRMLAPGMDDVVDNSDGAWGKVFNTAYRDKLLHTFSVGEMGPGTYITVFTAVDSHKADYRDHQNKHSLTKNDRKSNTPEIINDSRNGDRVVSGKEGTLPGGEKPLKIKIWPPGATVRLTLKRKLGAVGGIKGGAVFGNPTTKADLGPTIAIIGAKDATGKIAVAQPILILGRQVSDKRVNMILEVSKDSKPISATFVGQDPKKKDPWSFTVFRVDQTAYISGKVTAWLPATALANAGAGGAAGMNTLRELYDAHSYHTNDLGHVFMPDAATFGGIVIRGKIVPSGVPSSHFNKTHSRANSFDWRRRKFVRVYNSANGFAPIDVRFAIADDLSDSPSDDDKDLIPDSDGTSGELFIWVIDCPSAVRGEVPNGDISRSRKQFIQQVCYGGTIASEPLPWYWRSSQKREELAGPPKVSMYMQDNTFVGDNQIAINATTPLTPDLGVSLIPDFTVTNSTPLTATKGALSVSGTITGSSLWGALSVESTAIVVYMVNEKSTDVGTEVNIAPMTLDTSDISDTQMVGTYNLKDITTTGSYKVKVFQSDKVRTSPVQTQVVN